MTRKAPNDGERDQELPCLHSLKLLIKLMSYSSDYLSHFGLCLHETFFQ